SAMLKGFFLALAFKPFARAKLLSSAFVVFRGPTQPSLGFVAELNKLGNRGRKLAFALDTSQRASHSLNDFVVVALKNHSELQEKVFRVRKVIAAVTSEDYLGACLDPLRAVEDRLIQGHSCPLRLRP